MGFIKAKCTECGSPLEILEGAKKAECPHCGNVFLVEDAVNNYTFNTTNNIHANVVNVINPKEDFIIESGILKKYRGKSDIVFIPEGVKKIGDEAFENSGIAKAVLPDSVKIIGDSAFEDCESLEDVDFNRVEEIGNCAFRNSGIKSLLLPATLKKIGCAAFAYCNKLKSIGSEAVLEEVGADAFHGVCTKQLTLNAEFYSENIFSDAQIDEITVYGDTFNFLNMRRDNTFLFKRLNIRTKHIGKIILTYDMKDAFFVIGKEVEDIKRISIGSHTNIEAEDVDRFVDALIKAKGTCFASAVYHNGKEIESVNIDKEIDFGKDNGLFCGEDDTLCSFNIKIYSTVKQSVCPYCGAKYKGLFSKSSHKCDRCKQKYILKK